MKRGTDRLPDPAAGAYLRLSRIAGGRYGLDLWLREAEPRGAGGHTGHRHWYVDRDLPESAARYISRALRSTYDTPDPAAMRCVARELWDALIPEEARELFAGRTPTAAQGRRSRGTGGPRRGGSRDAAWRFRIELRDPVLHYLPWEYVVSDAHIPPGVTTYPARFEVTSADSGALRTGLPLRVLFVSASPSMSKMAIGVESEYQRMAEAAAELAEGDVEVVPLLDPDRHALASTLASSWFHVLHIACHGMLAASGPVLALQSRGRSQFLAPADVGALARASGVRLLTLQTPFSAPNYQIAAFAGFAAQGRALGLPGLLFELRKDSRPQPAVAGVYAGLARGVALDAACAQAERAGGDRDPVLGLSLFTREPRLFEIETSQAVAAPEVLETASAALHSLVVDQDAEEHRKLVEMVESGATENEVAQMLAWHVKAGAPSPEAVPGRAADQIGKVVAHGVVKEPRTFAVKGLDRASLEEATRSTRQQALQELDYVRGNVAQLEEMQAAYKSPPGWLAQELAAQRTRLDQLRDELEGEV